MNKTRAQGGSLRELPAEYQNTFTCKMPSRVPPNSSSDNNTTNMNSFNSRLDLSTSITSPLRRIPSFVAEEEDFEEEFARSSMKSSPSTAGPNKKKRTHSVEVIENEFGQLNRLQEDQSLQSSDFPL